jgi:hypothetical protein
MSAANVIACAFVGVLVSAFAFFLYGFARAALAEGEPARKWMRQAFDAIAERIIAWHRDRRPVDFAVGKPGDWYLLRWWVIPRNPILNVYLHCFLRSDDDRALHDHPWPWCSILLRDSYIEHTIAQGGIHVREQRNAPSIKASTAGRAHRVELLEGEFGPKPCWTLFITGPRIRAWGFHCPDKGWIPWEQFTAPGDKGQVGPGCDA